MAYCWRMEAVPELRDLPRKRQRALWREAVSRSASPRGVIGTLLAVFAAGMVGGGVGLMWFPQASPLWMALPTMAVAWLGADRWFRRPAACRWLHEHADELDRYVPA